jgi:formate-dependent nitrite reductase membrane component NrfD
MAGGATLAIVNVLLNADATWTNMLHRIMIIAIVVNVSTIILEMVTTHPTKDAKRTVNSILHGRYRKMFWLGVVLLGNIIPVVLIAFGKGDIWISALTGLFVLIGIYFTEHIWVEAPQRVPLS